ncbi:MAG: low temperature requirement protein A [Solirubrobacterales bacterium]|nr:low temperature requirement protein A [Solirubrobacterales bacterium]
MTEPAAAAPEDDETPNERETGSVELLWDLVFVFAVTQVTTLFAADPSWKRFGQSMIVLALIWWAWSAFVWATDALEPESLSLRRQLLIATVLIFVAGLSLPHAFGDEVWPFAIAYVLVRFIHLWMYADASRGGTAARPAILGFAISVGAGMLLLLVGAALGGVGQVVLWLAALAIDYGGPGWLTRARLRGLQRVAVAHFADRYGDFIIICLGESIVAIGVGVSERGHALSAALVVIATLGVLIALAMWWTYFDAIAARAQERLRGHVDPVLAASDAYSYLHLIIVAGIIIFAGAIKVVVHNRLGQPMPAAGRLAFDGGIATYLIGVAVFRLRLLGEHSPARLTTAAVLAASAILGGDLPAWLITASATAVMLALCAVEFSARRRQTASAVRGAPAQT